MKKIFIIAILFHLAAAWFSIGRYHADEQFQILEFAKYKEGGNAAEALPWEFHEKIRPGMQPAIAFAVMQTAQALGAEDPFVIAFFLRLFVSLLGLYASYRLVRLAANQLSATLYNTLVFLSLCWCFIPWFHARFSSENLSASLFILGSVFYLENGKEKSALLKVLLAGVFFGLSGVIRFQSYFLAGGFFLWMLFIHKEKISSLLLLICGMALSFFSGLLCDKWLYGSWEFTSWNYVYQNFFLHKAENFGKEPLWFYFEKTVTDALPPFSIVLIFALFFHFFRLWKSWLTWSLVPFLLIHFISPHKELRFLFVLIPLLPLCVLYSYKNLMEGRNFQQVKDFFSGRLARAFRYLFVVINFVMLGYLSFKPADDYTPALSFLYKNYHASGALLFCEDHAVNPYTPEVSLNYYRSSQILVSEGKNTIDSLMRLFPHKKVLYVSSNRQLHEIEGHRLKRVWSSFPQWLLNFNVNGWADRVNQVCIYEAES